MFLINKAMENIDLGTAGIVAVLGYAVVFVGLVLLMWVIMIMGKIMVSSQKKKAAKLAAAQAEKAPQPVEAPVVAAEPAKGTAGKLMLHNVPARDAAMVMAVVAYKLQTPINELRFKSIQEVKEQ